MQDNSEKTRLKKAKQKVAELKGFYTHLTVYLVINTMLLVFKFVGNAYFGDAFMGPFWHFSTFAVWFFWGIGLLFHGLKVFSATSIFSKNWEEKQIRKYLEEDKKNTEKFR